MCIRTRRGNMIEDEDVYEYWDMKSDEDQNASQDLGQIKYRNKKVDWDENKSQEMSGKMNFVEKKHTRNHGVKFLKCQFLLLRAIN